MLDDVLAGIERGIDLVGSMDLARDARDFDEEAAQEARDLLVYLAMGRVAAQHRRREQIERDAADAEVTAPRERVESPVLAGLRELRDAVSANAAAPGVLLDWHMDEDGLDGMFDTSEVDLGGGEGG